MNPLKRLHGCLLAAAIVTAGPAIATAGICTFFNASQTAGTVNSGVNSVTIQVSVV